MSEPQVPNRLQMDKKLVEFTCQDYLARHKDEQHYLGLLHAVDQACTADAVRVRTAQAYEDRQLDAGVMHAMELAYAAEAERVQLVCRKKDARMQTFQHVQL